MYTELSKPVPQQFYSPTGDLSVDVDKLFRAPPPPFPDALSWRDNKSLYCSSRRNNKRLFCSRWFVSETRKKAKKKPQK